jgi:beta-carotene 15,15'-dioxygenase
MQRSVIGCIACGLLILACVIDRGQGSLDFLDWPGHTAIVVLIMGLPHGALDIEILKTAKGNSAQFRFVRSIVSYVSAVLIALAFWWFLPTGALVLLLLLSAYHFGGDWPGLKSRGESLVVGAALLTAPALLHAAPVAQIFSWLVSPPAAQTVASVMHWLSVPLLLAVAASAAFNWKNSQAQYEEIAVVLFAAVVLQPLTFFLIYFCALHSLRHLADVRQNLSTETTSMLIRRGAPYAFIALVGCCAGALLFPQLAAGPALLSAMFVGLSALTVPHMLLRHLP